MELGGWLGLASRKPLDPLAFEREPLGSLGQCVGADTLVKGTNAEHGWFYAVIFSFVRVRAAYEMYKADTGRQVWSGEGSKANLEWVLSSSFLDIPFKLVTVWLNTRGEPLSRSADAIARSLTKNLPDVPRPARVSVRATSRRTPVFSRNTYAFWRKRGSVPAGTQMKLLLERNGWFQVQTMLKGKDVTGWVFRADAELVDEAGTVLRPRLTASAVYFED
jgi:hypothetical protein